MKELHAICMDVLIQGFTIYDVNVIVHFPVSVNVIVHFPVSEHIAVFIPTIFDALLHGSCIVLENMLPLPSLADVASFLFNHE